MTKTGPVKSIDNTGPSPPSHCQNMTTHLLLIPFDMFTPAFNLPQASDHIFECPHLFLTLATHFWVVLPIFNLFKHFWLSSSVWMCRHILLTTLEWLNIFLTTHTHSQAPLPIFKLNHSFSTNFTLFDYFHPFLTIFTLFFNWLYLFSITFIYFSTVPC